MPHHSLAAAFRVAQQFDLSLAEVVAIASSLEIDCNGANGTDNENVVPPS